MVITVIPLFDKINTAAWEYFHENESSIAGITSNYLSVAIAETVLKGDNKDLYSAVNNKRYPGLTLRDMPCLWVESIKGHFITPLPTDKEHINRLLACLADAAMESKSWNDFKQLVISHTNSKASKPLDESWNPLFILNGAIKVVPAMRYALAVLSLVSVVSIVAAWRIDYRVAVFGAVIVFALMVPVLGFARLARFPNKDFRWPMVVLLWSFVLMIILMCSFLITAVSFRFPSGLYELLFTKPTAINTNSRASGSPHIPSTNVLHVANNIELRINHVDDRIRITLNGTNIYEGGPATILIKKGDLNNGDNNLDVDLFNNSTRTGGIIFLGGARKEGWGYSMTLTIGLNQFPYSGSHDNDPPDSQWGQWFSVRRLILNVHVDNQTITVRDK